MVFLSLCSLHWSLVIICHPGEVANLRGMISSHHLLQFVYFLIVTFSASNLDILVQTKLWMSHLSCHAFYTWILLEEVIKGSRILLEGKLLEFDAHDKPMLFQCNGNFLQFHNFIFHVWGNYALHLVWSYPSHWDNDLSLPQNLFTL